MEHQQSPVSPDPVATEHASATEAAAPQPQGGPGRTVPLTTVRRTSRGVRLLNVALASAIALAIAGVAFAAGRLTAPSAVAAGRFGNGAPGQVFDGNGNGGGRGQGGAGGFLAGGGITIEGTVESITDTTLTLKTASGQTIQVALNDTTTYHAQSDASAGDVKTGGTVLVRLNLRGGANGGPGSSPGTGTGGPTNPSARDVMLVP